MKRNSKGILVVASLLIVVVIIAAALSLMGSNKAIGSSNGLTRVTHTTSSSFLPAVTCGGIATSSWYLYSSTGQNFKNFTEGSCAISSSIYCSFPAGYYAC